AGPEAEIAHGPEAMVAHGPEAEAAEAPVSPPVILSADEDRTRSLLNIASDTVTTGDISMREKQTIAETADGAAVPAEWPAAAAWHAQQEPPQDHINVAAEMPEDKDEAASGALAVDGTGVAPTFEAACAAPVAETAGGSAAVAAPIDPVAP